ncbi:MAG: ABC transporter substrate-binding protein [Armatimonadota bacterium]|nr:ABC transporter substrate-binding protein [Armatimonadota bacterium]MDR7426279.1 ABC transporter substrate-binding protein [Armatimonadota bacterium]MDR7463321.1 ABC transporter substrate-binding protein [Armatimonadota bacterium]MDR7470161.1 ABC transporter substrate-binding protein [Armatimonadota bacterium]MDR7473990.1 ABC transporter substrate-binding protein [Armatimonadota bacterium]
MRKVFGLALALMLASLGGASAAPAGKVTVLCSPNPAWCDAVRVEFAKATGISVDFVRLSSGEALARLRAEGQNPSFDVWFGGTGDPHIVANETGLTEFYKPKAWDDLRPEFREAVAGKYIPLYAGILGWALNERLLKEKGLPVPRTWRDLADPRYRGLIAYPNPNTSGTGYTMLATIVQIYGEREAFELLKRIHRNVAEYTRSGAAPGQLAGRGEVAIGITFIHDAVDQVLKGFPITYNAPSDGTGYEIGGLSLVKATRNRANAIIFIDWALTPEAQKLAAEQGQSYQIPSNMKTPIPRVAPRFQDFKVIKYDFLKYGSAAVRDTLVKKWTTEIFPLPK